MKGGNVKVAYIDTEGTFQPDIIVAIAERFGMDPGAALGKGTYLQPFDKRYLNCLTWPMKFYQW